MAGSKENVAYALVDELVPEALDWERLVREYPIPALLLAGLGGFLLGRGRGTVVLTALATFAAEQLALGVNDALGRDVL